MKNKKICFLTILLFIFTFILTFYKFTQIPKFLAFDEVEFTKLALSLNNKPYSAYSLLATGHSTLYFYILLLSLKIFGINVFALRFPAAIFAILSVIIFYLIIKKIFNHNDFNQKNKSILEVFKEYFPYLLTFIFLTSRWFINFSRFAFEPTFLLFLELTSIYFLINSDIIYDNKDKIIRNNYFSLILSGIFSGLAFNSYTPGRFFFLVPLFFIVRKFFISINKGLKKDYKNNLKTFLFFIIPFLLVITPLIYSLSSIKDTRIDQLFFWRNHEMSIQQKVDGTIQNITSLTSMFFLKGDMNGRHNYPGKPALNTIISLLFTVGIVYSLKNWKNNINKLFVLYFLISVIPSVPIYPWENPSMLRTFTTIPSIIYFVGNGLIVILELFKKTKISKKRIFNILLVLIFVSSFYELRTYFKYQKVVFEESFEIKYPLEKAIKMKNPYEKII